MKTNKELRHMIYDRHDIYCNQKYNGYPYSLHLKAVVAQAYKYRHLLEERFREMAYLAAAGHDLIEDARITYNDVRDLYGGGVAQIIYACTELRGRDRHERHGKEYMELLASDRVAVYVKLCDITANVIFSMLTNSGMYAKYHAEFPNLYSNLHIVGEYEELWDDLRDLLKQ